MTLYQINGTMEERIRRSAIDRVLESSVKKDAKLSIITIDDSLMNDEDMQKIFDWHGKLNRHSNVPPIAMECIKKR